MDSKNEFIIGLKKRVNNKQAQNRIVEHKIVVIKVQNSYYNCL